VTQSLLCSALDTRCPNPFLWLRRHSDSYPLAGFIPLARKMRCFLNTFSGLVTGSHWASMLWLTWPRRAARVPRLSPSLHGSAGVRSVFILHSGSRCFAGALGAGDLLWVRARGWERSRSQPRAWGEEEHRSTPAMSANSRRTFLLTEAARVRLRAWHWLRAGSTLCAGVSQLEKERVLCCFFFSFFSHFDKASRCFVLLEFAYL